MLAQVERCRIGARIRITEGPLEGATGTIARMPHEALKYHLTIDGFGGGVFVAIGREMFTVDGGIMHVAAAASQSLAKVR